MRSFLFVGNNISKRGGIAMKKNGFTLIELLAVIIILSVVLTITVPTIFDAIKSSTKRAFVISTENILQAIANEVIQNRYFDITTINAGNMELILGIDNDNYESITVVMMAEKMHITVVGKNKWVGYTTCGTPDKISIVEGSIGCV